MFASEIVETADITLLLRMFLDGFLTLARTSSFSPAVKRNCLILIMLKTISLKQVFRMNE